MARSGVEWRLGKQDAWFVVKLARLVLVPLWIARLAVLTPFGDVASVKQVGRLNVSHALLGGPKNMGHHKERGFAKPRPYISQDERLEAVRRTFLATNAAFQSLGLPLFLDSGTLLGKLRHADEGEMIPWDSDADTAMSREECERKFPDPEARLTALNEALKRQEKLGFAFTALRFHCVPAKRVAARVVDRKTGFFVDVFSYEDLNPDATALTESQKQRSSQWIHRVHWDASFNRTPIQCPRETLYPLKTATFLGTQVFVPQDEQAYLECQYGRNLGVPVWPFQTLLYTRTTFVTLAAVVTAIAVLTRGDFLELAAAGLWALVPRSNGLRLACLAYLLLGACLSVYGRRPTGGLWTRNMAASAAVAWLLVLRDGWQLATALSAAIADF